MTRINDMVAGSCLNYLLIAFSLLTMFDCVYSLKLIGLRVPPQVPLGTRALLTCRWQLSPADVLYYVKWYKDGKEFFRHVPREVEPRRQFPLPGVSVEKSDSFGSCIELSKATYDTSGRYRCEVSGDSPLFHTVSDHADMYVVVLPTRGPTISGVHPRYVIGDRLQGNCTSVRSESATRLTWYINGEPAPVDTVSPPLYRTYEDQKNITVLLDFIITAKHFRENELHVKCIATMGTIYWQSTEKSALLEKLRVNNTSEPSMLETYLWADRDLSNLAQVPSSSLCDHLIATYIIVLYFRT